MQQLELRTFEFKNLSFDELEGEEDVAFLKLADKICGSVWISETIVHYDEEKPVSKDLVIKCWATDDEWENILKIWRANAKTNELP